MEVSAIGLYPHPYTFLSPMEAKIQGDQYLELTSSQSVLLLNTFSPRIYAK